MPFDAASEGTAVPDPTMEQIPLKHLSRKQRRVLGTLLEKAFTTPEQYPLTLKAAIAGCNQKSNREPVTNYDEDAVQQTLEELREIGFVGVVHTESGRTERYRHYLRHRTSLNERQLAIMTELMLRGRQQPGELRTRAGRMVAIDSLEDLRQELQALLDQGLVRANGPLERRGIEVDHNLYAPGENHEALSAYQEESVSARPVAEMERREAAPRATVSAPRSEGLETAVAALTEQVSDLRQQLAELKDEVADLRRQLGA